MLPRTRGLQLKILAWSFVPTVIILFAVAVVIYYAYQDVTGDLVIGRNRELTRLAAGQIASELEEYAALLEGEARTGAMLAGEPQAQRQALKAAHNRLAIFDGGTLILDTGGSVVAAEPERPEILGQDWSGRSFYQQMVSSEATGAARAVFSDVLPDGPGGADVVAISVPIEGLDGGLVGVLAGMFHVGRTANNALYGDMLKLRLGEGGDAFLVDSQARVIWHTDAAYIAGDASALPYVQQVISGQAGALRARDAEGQDIVASFSPIPGTPWAFVDHESWQSLMASSRGYRQILILLLALGVLVPSVVVTVGVRRITRPVRQLIAAAQRVAGGDFDQSISAPTGDEIEELADQFNRMAAQLHESYTKLEERAEARSRELAALNAIAALVSQSPDLSHVLSGALQETLRVMGVEAGGIYLLDEATALLRVATHEGLDDELVAGIDELRIGEGFSGRVAETGEPLVVRDVASDPRLTRLAVRERGLHSLATVPLSSRGRVLGTLFAMTHGYREFTDQDLQLLTSIGQQIGIAADNARLFSQAATRMQELEALYRADEEMLRHLELDRVLQALVDVAVNILGADKSAVLVWNTDRSQLVMRVARGFGRAAMRAMSFSPGEGSTGQVAVTGQPKIVLDLLADLQQASGRPELAQAALAEGIRSCMHLPIKLDGETFGVFDVCYTEPHLFAESEQRLFTALAQRAGLAIEKARLFREEQRRAEQFRVISEVGREITSILTPDELLSQMARLIQEGFNYYHVGIGIVEGDEVVYRVGAGPLWSDPEFEFAPPRLKIGEEGITGWVAATGRPLVVPDVSQEPRYVWMRGSRTRSELALPIMLKDKVLAVLDVQSDRLGAFDQTDLAALQALAHQAAVAMDNARLYAQAQHVAVMEERNRLARDLHDAVTQTLFSASLIAEALPGLWKTDPEAAQELLGELRRLSRGALAEMRTLLLELRPASLVETSLADLLRQLGEATTGRTGIPVHVNIERYCALPTDVHVAFYRIAQEALNNVVKHANASHVEVSLRCTPRVDERTIERPALAELRVTDDGCGFDVARLDTDGLGLKILRERAEAIGAALAVNSAPGQGTTVSLIWTGDGR